MAEALQDTEVSGESQDDEETDRESQEDAETDEESREDGETDGESQEEDGESQNDAETDGESQEDAESDWESQEDGEISTYSLQQNMNVEIPGASQESLPIAHYLEESHLKDILRDPAVNQFNNWEEVGLELGLEASCIKKIDKDERGKTDDCKREMFIQWLENETEPTWDKLYAAMKRANRKCAETDGEKALDMIHNLKRVVRRWETTDTELRSDLGILVNNLKKQEERVTKARQWKEENIEWEDGDDANMTKDLENAISRGHFVNNRFVVEFLRQKGLPHPSKMRAEAVRGTLIRGIADIRIDRTQALIPQFKKLKYLKKKLEILRANTIKLSTLIDKRTIQGDEIIKNLLDLGVKAKELQNLKDQITSLRKTAQESVELTNEYDQTYEETEEHVQKWKHDLEAYNNSLERNITDMEDVKLTYIQSIKLLDATSWLRIGGAAGGVLGSLAFFGVGTAIGAVTGAAIGAMFGRITKQNRLSQREILHYKDTLQRAQTAHYRLETLLYT